MTTTSAAAPKEVSGPPTRDPRDQHTCPVLASRVDAVPPNPPPDAAPADGPVGWAVRMDWADGTHAIVGFTRRHARAQRRQKALIRWWAPGPARPCSYRVVAIRREQWRRHINLPMCARPECPEP